MQELNAKLAALAADLKLLAEGSEKAKIGSVAWDDFEVSRKEIMNHLAEIERKFDNVSGFVPPTYSDTRWEPGEILTEIVVSQDIVL